MSSNIQLQKTCQYCGKKFIAQKTTTKCCSLQCGQRAYKQRKRDEKVQTAIQQDEQVVVMKPDIVSKEFLSIAETCDLIGASRWTIYRMIDNGNLKAAKFGKRTIIQRAEINNLFK